MLKIIVLIVSLFIDDAWAQAWRQDYSCDDQEECFYPKDNTIITWLLGGAALLAFFISRYFRWSVFQYIFLMLVLCGGGALITLNFGKVAGILYLIFCFVFSEKIVNFGFKIIPPPEGDHKNDRDAEKKFKIDSLDKGSAYKSVKKNYAIDQLNNLLPVHLGWNGANNLEQKANLGDRDALFELGKIYVTGCDSFCADIELAKKYFSRAAKLGHEVANQIVSELERGRVIANKNSITKLDLTKISKSNSSALGPNNQATDRLGNQKEKYLVKEKYMTKSAAQKKPPLKWEVAGDVLCNCETRETFRIVRDKEYPGVNEVVAGQWGYEFHRSAKYVHISLFDVRKIN